MRKAQWLFIVFILVQLLSCTQQQAPTIRGTWMGSGYDLDENFQLPTYFLLSFDETQLIQKKNLKIDTFQYQIQPNSIDQKLVLSDKKISQTIKEQLFTLSKNILRYKGSFNHSFHKITSFPTGIEKTTLKNKLCEGYWKNKQEVLEFEKEGNLKSCYFVK